MLMLLPGGVCVCVGGGGGGGGGGISDTASCVCLYKGGQLWMQHDDRRAIHLMMIQDMV